MSELSRDSAQSEPVEPEPPTSAEPPVDLKSLLWDAEHGDEPTRLAANLKINGWLADRHRPQSEDRTESGAASGDLATSLFASLGPIVTATAQETTEAATSPARVYTDAEIEAARGAMIERQATNDGPASPRFLKFADWIRTRAALPMIYHWIECRHEEALWPEDMRRFILGDSTEPAAAADINTRELARHLAEELRQSAAFAEPAASGQPSTTTATAHTATDKGRTYNSDARTLIIGALLEHHQFEDWRGCKKLEPTTGAAIRKAIKSPGVKVSKQAISDFFRKTFGSQDEYESLCRRGDSEKLNQILRGLSDGGQDGRARSTAGRDLDSIGSDSVRT